MTAYANTVLLTEAASKVVFVSTGSLVEVFFTPKPLLNVTSAFLMMASDRPGVFVSFKSLLMNGSKSASTVGSGEGFDFVQERFRPMVESSATLEACLIKLRRCISEEGLLSEVNKLGELEGAQV